MMESTSPQKGIFAVLPTVGGQTALNLAVELADSGVLEKYNVQLIRGAASRHQDGGRPAVVQRRHEAHRAGCTQAQRW